MYRKKNNRDRNSEFLKDKSLKAIEIPLLKISKGNRNSFIKKLLKVFTDNQEIVLRVTDKETKSKLTFYSSTGRSGEGLKHGFKQLERYISLRNLATLLGVDKNNLLATDNQFHILYKIEQSILNYNRLTNGAMNDAFKAFCEYIKQIRLNYYIYKAFRKRSNDDFSITKLCRLLRIEGESLLFQKVQYDTVISRLVNIYFLQEQIESIGIKSEKLKELKRECYKICLNYLFEIKRIKSKVSEDTFDIIFHSLLVLNGGMNPPSKQVSLADLSSRVSPAEEKAAQKTYLYGVLHRGSRIRIGHLNNLLRLMRNGTYIKSPHDVIKKVRKYLHTYYWKTFKVKENGYHRYWDRDELKATLIKILFQETLGLDVNVFNFIKIDLGDKIEVHHIFENIESISLKDLAPLLTNSHKSLTFTYKTEQEWKVSCNIIFQRRLLFREFSLLNYTMENETKIRYNLNNNKLCVGMSDIIKEEWFERWKDRNRMKEEDWYKKYQLSSFYFRYNNLIEHLRKIASLRNVRSKFVIWYFEHFLQKYI